MGGAVCWGKGRKGMKPMESITLIFSLKKSGHRVLDSLARSHSGFVRAAPPPGATPHPPFPFTPPPPWGGHPHLQQQPQSGLGEVGRPSWISKPVVFPGSQTSGLASALSDPAEFQHTSKTKERANVIRTKCFYKLMKRALIGKGFGGRQARGL